MSNQLDAIWLANRDSLSSYIARRTSREEAQDIVQEVAVKALGSGTPLAGMDNPRAWLFAVARNAVIDHYRRRRPMDQLDDGLAGPGEAAHDFEEIGRCLAPLIEAVPDTLRRALVMADMQGVKQQEVARQLGISVPAAKSRILRGRAELRRRIEACCELEFDARGSLMDYTPRRAGCPGECGVRG